ncbi:hypothetical protein [Microvirga sp. G4-2]|uniref:hypothetical protein n=1 Tax=Microvirga sp. G4-2 TaxID=3434467 RepID=UPI0040449DE1
MPSEGLVAGDLDRPQVLRGVRGREDRKLGLGAVRRDRAGDVGRCGIAGLKDGVVAEREHDAVGLLPGRHRDPVAERSEIPDRFRETDPALATVPGDEVDQAPGSVDALALAQTVHCHVVKNNRRARHYQSYPVTIRTELEHRIWRDIEQPA